MVKYIMLGLIAILFTGCFGATPERIVETKTLYKDKVIMIKPPKHLMVKVVVPKPPKREIFIHTDNVTRINLLSNYTIELLKALGESNDQIGAIESWSKDVDGVYNE